MLQQCGCLRTKTSRVESLPSQARAPLTMAGLFLYWLNWMNVESKLRQRNTDSCKIHFILFEKRIKKFHTQTERNFKARSFVPIVVRSFVRFKKECNFLDECVTQMFQCTNVVCFIVDKCRIKFVFKTVFEIIWLNKTKISWLWWWQLITVKQHDE